MSESLPIRGAWIEIFTPLNEEEESQRRSPSGERGLKYNRHHRVIRAAKSLPIRGAWIEITPATIRAVGAVRVAPHPGSVD